MTPASAAATAATTTAFAVSALAPRFHPVTPTLVTRAALDNLARRQTALFPAIPRTSTILEPAHAESRLTFVGALGLVTRRQRLTLRPAGRTILARPAIAASTTTTPAAPFATLAARARLDAFARLTRLRDRLVATLLASRLTRGASTPVVRRALPVTPSTVGATRRTFATAPARTTATGTARTFAITATIPAAALFASTTASAIPTTATAAAAALGSSAAITPHTAWLLGFLFTHRAARTRRHPHTERTGTEAEKTRRSFLHHGDHCLGARQAQRRQSLVHCLLERPAFEDVAPGIGHAFLVWGAPGSCVSTGDRRAVSEP